MTFDGDDPLEQHDRRTALDDRRAVVDRRHVPDERFTSSRSRTRALNAVATGLAVEPALAHLTPAERGDLARRLVRLMADVGLPV